KATTETTMAEILANGSAAEDEFIPPTIAVPDSVVAEVKEATKSGEIPITKTAPTGDLTAGDKAPEAADGEEAATLGIGGSPQDYEGYVLPGTEFLTEGPPHIEHKEQELLRIADSLAEKTKEFNVAGKVVNICPGPVVTTYEFKPDPGVKYSRVTGLVDDLC